MTHGSHTADWLRCWERHQANIAATLTRRIQAAQANNDRHLLALLAQEEAELSHLLAPSPFPKSILKIQHWWKMLTDWGQTHAQVSVEHVEGSHGQIWRVHDPRTGQSRYAQSAAEVMEWIETNRLGD